jgi:hypothetical protein
MTQKERELILRDLCARLPYRVICRKDCKTVDNEDFYLNKYPNPIELAKYLTIDDMDITIKPYLRPISSMTTEEKEDFDVPFTSEGLVTIPDTVECMDWLNAHHFDYRGLIHKGLALEAPEGMYK